MSTQSEKGLEVDTSSADPQSWLEKNPPPKTPIKNKPSATTTMYNQSILDLLGGAIRATPRTEAEINKQKVPISKKDRDKLKPAELEKFKRQAVEGIPSKFAFLKPKQGTEELQNVYNLAIKLNQLREKLETFDMADEFETLPTTDDGVLLPNAPTVNCFTNYKDLTLDMVRRSTRAYYLLADKDYVVENLAWSAEMILNSCETDLKDKIMDKTMHLSGLEKSGPLYLLIMLQEIFSVSDKSLRALVTRIQNMNLKQYKGENVVTAAGHLRTMIMILDNCNFTPTDVKNVVCAFFKTASDEEFCASISFIETAITTKIQAYTVDEILNLAESWYLTKIAAGTWDKAAESEQGDSSVFASIVREETRTCYRCGKKGHIAPNCP